MTPGVLIHEWVRRFNEADADGLALLYHPDAVNHQVNQDPVVGRSAIRDLFAREFAVASMQCIVEQVLEDGDWGVLEWRDPIGLRGCGFFLVQESGIRLQRGYWDRLTFLRLHGLPVPTS